MPAWNPRANEIFLSLLDQPDPAARQARLMEACGDDAGLREQVEALLHAHTGAGGFLEQPATGEFIPDAPSAEPGTVVASRYKLLQEIGAGGMGAVWMAEQLVPVKRMVALKLIKPGMDSRQVLARFEAERQALALMDHPNIAKVLDGGTTDSGRPFFVMELVKGLPLTQYCDERQLTVRQRIDLFAAVCNAVQHAHQKGIIHRDIKPSNVLVTEHDGTPVPKVIDFGLAKAVQGPHALTDRTLFTAFGAVAGTPSYMAPEQVALNALDVDTRTDVYALGVLLYELLTGTTPLEPKRLKQAAWDEVRRLIREEEPPCPSKRLSTSDALPSIAARRHAAPAQLGRLVRGDLDWIVMRALEKDRNRRYPTANALGRDLQRYLADEPVEAGPPSVAYRVRKLVRKHRAQITSVMMIGALAVLGILGIAWQIAARRNAAAEHSANAREAVRTALVRADAALIAGRLTEVDSVLDVARTYLPFADLPSTELDDIALARQVREELSLAQEQRWTVPKDGFHFDSATALKRYRSALNKLGLETTANAVGPDSPARAVATVKASRIGAPVMEALEDCFFLEPNINLKAVLDRLDPNVHRTVVRTAVLAGDEAQLGKLAKVLKSDEHNPNFIANLTQYASPDDAQQRLTDALNYWPNSIPLNLAICVSFQFPGSDENKAREFCARCRVLVALLPNRVTHRLRLAWALMAAKDKREAHAVLSRAVALDPSFAPVHLAMGYCCFTEKNYEDAVDAFSRAAALEPDNVSARGGLFVALVRRGDDVAAREVLQRTKDAELRHGDVRHRWKTLYENVTGMMDLWGLTMLQSGTEVDSMVVKWNTAGRFRTAFEFCEGEICQPWLNNPNFRTNFLGACAGVQLAAGMGPDPPPVSERPKFRHRALEWVTARLEVWRQCLMTKSDLQREWIHYGTGMYLSEPLLAPVRDAASLATLPADERAGWENFWASVRALHAETAPPKTGPPPDGTVPLKTDSPPSRE